MKKVCVFAILAFSVFLISVDGFCAEDKQAQSVKKSEYIVGVDDVLDINILQPDKLATTVTVALDGSITFPYIGNVYVKGMSLNEVQETIQKKLSEGYMKYPVASVSLRESRSKKFFVYGEVIKPGSYLLEEDITVLKAISMAGGFSKFGSSSRVKIMRPNKGKPGFQPMNINMDAVMKGRSEADVLIQPGDIIVVSEGVF